MLYMHVGNNSVHSALDMNKLYHCHEIIVLNVMWNWGFDGLDVVWVIPYANVCKLWGFQYCMWVMAKIGIWGSIWSLNQVPTTGIMWWIVLLMLNVNLGQLVWFLHAWTGRPYANLAQVSQARLGESCRVLIMFLLELLA